MEDKCPLCKFIFRDPVSGRCGHPICLSCLVVYFSRDLPDMKEVSCPTCDSKLVLSEVKPDKPVQRKLKKKGRSCKCNHCSWKGTYNKFIQNHEGRCQGESKEARIQCKVLGCGKWLPAKRALDVHRTDDWCPMILLMKASLNHAEIDHLSMQETWDWTCGLVLRSDKSSVRSLIERLVLVFSALDPKVPSTLDNDEYAANQTSEIDCPSEPMGTDSNHVESGTSESKDVGRKQNRSNGRSSPGDETDGHSLDRSLSTAGYNAGASHAGGATNGYFPSSKDGDADSFEDMEYRSSTNDKEFKKSVRRDFQRIDDEARKVKRDIDGLLKDVDDLMNMPKAFAAIHEKQELFQCVLATLNKDIMAVHSRLDKMQMTPNFSDQGLTDKLQKKCQELEQAVASHRQYGQKLDERLVDLEISHSGVYLWKIANYNEKKRNALNTNVKSLYSRPFFTSQYGYKLCGRVFLMGDGVGKGTHISLFLTIMKGPHDAVLPWPFDERIIFQLVNQDDPVNKSIVKAFRPDPASSSFKKPTSEKNIAAGCPLFAKIKLIEDPMSGFVRDNTIYLKIISQTKESLSVTPWVTSQKFSPEN